MDAKFLQFLVLISSIFVLSFAFTPQDNYLINCGSSTSTVAVDNRFFLGDSSNNASVYLSKGKSISLANPNPVSVSSVLYTTARLFTSASSYTFKIKNSGTHLVRLHFSPFVSNSYDLKNGEFNVMANGFSILSKFVANVTVVKEFFMMVDKVELEIMFTPSSDSNFAYVNAIEVFSVPEDFFVDAGGVALISPNGIQEFRQNISALILETVHRINVGGSKLTSFNDTLWRTWIPDEDFLVLKSAAKVARTFDPPNYQPGGATRENAPDNVYMTAQQMNVANGSLNFLFNITWDFPVSREGDDTMHFVRLHFCDIVSVALNTLYFNIYINGIIAYKDVDLSALSFHELASPYYIDFVVKNTKDSGFERISIGPSDLSNTLRKNAILNGVEIMKVLDSVPLKRRPKKKSVWILAGSVLGGFFALSLAILTSLAILKCCKRKSKPKTKRPESGGWTFLRVYGSSSRDTGSDGNALASPGPYGYYDLKIPFTDIKLATKDFDKNLIVGSGGFGMVYKGVLKDNILVAVKRGMPGSRQGLPEFHTEITVLSKIRHHHLVSLVGYCEEQSEMILVYEYMEKAEWAMEWQKKGMIEQIVDPQLVGSIKPNSLKKFGETAEKCLADYGVDRPTMGDVLWNLEHAYQLQTNERIRERDDTGAPGVVTGVNLSRIGVDSDEGILDISTSRVFSQLITNEGR
ncbi:hypothetical protein ACJIZ3_009077 [Penstemon smallii]|uniref:Protein kinase domain-containing protein n=1 Tax=Penstemon smallii TaxID=265156 RepID=A0ABD3TCK7_9LAMI